MSPNDCLVVELPPDFLGGTVSDLLDRVFPADAEGRRLIAQCFDTRDNPDLPDIYDVLLAVCDEWRDWRCALWVSVQGERLELDTTVSGLVQHTEGPPQVSFYLEQEYRPLEYAVRHGFWPGPDELFAWMRSLVALYFLDKHEAILSAPASAHTGPAMARALADLQSPGLIAPRDPEEDEGDDPEDDGQSLYAITPEGRRFIAILLTETESHIEAYDHYQDTLVALDRDAVEFGTGRGIDLRVEAFLAEGLDPIRAVFLLRLYDGTLDSRLRDWTEGIETGDLFDGLLEPVVNRHSLGLEDMREVLEFGHAWLEEQQDLARREAADRDLLRRAGTKPSSE